ncbi:class I SAM-dependent methyltransferase [Gracilimonas sp. BCB1]|uniref:class I SAM-dependent methyltransferase n=1 Tax=Gracilimonas sp. BCB1 TaxID=3152362 RepID=UPI0032D95868
MNPREAVIPFFKLLFKDQKKILKSLLNYTKEADKRLSFKNQYKQIGLPFVDLQDLVDINESIQNYTYLNGSSRPIDIALLMALCRKYENCNYLEIGSWRGESLVNVAKVASKCTSVSLSKDDMLSMGMNKKAADLQRLFSSETPNVTHIEANSLEYDFDQLNQKFDVIFVDGDHTYKGVKSDTMNAFKLLRNEDSVIVWHDCGGGFEGYRYEVISAIMDGTPPEKRNKIYRVSNTLCGIYTNQDLTSEFTDSPQTPNKVFSIDIKMNSYSTSLD